jgi:hypothetical protein
VNAVRVIDVPGLGDEAVIAETDSGTILLLDPDMPADDRMDCMHQVMERAMGREIGHSG